MLPDGPFCSHLKNQPGADCKNFTLRQGYKRQRTLQQAQRQDNRLHRISVAAWMFRGIGPPVIFFCRQSRIYPTQRPPTIVTMRPAAKYRSNGIGTMPAMFILFGFRGQGRGFARRDPGRRGGECQRAGHFPVLFALPRSNSLIFSSISEMCLVCKES